MGVCSSSVHPSPEFHLKSNRPIKQTQENHYEQEKNQQTNPVISSSSSHSEASSPSFVDIYGFPSSSPPSSVSFFPLSSWLPILEDFSSYHRYCSSSLTGILIESAGIPHTIRPAIWAKRFHLSLPHGANTSNSASSSYSSEFPHLSSASRHQISLDAPRTHSGHIYYSTSSGTKTIEYFLCSIFNEINQRNFPHHIQEEYTQGINLLGFLFLIIYQPWIFHRESFHIQSINHSTQEFDPYNTLLSIDHSSSSSSPFSSLCSPDFTIPTELFIRFYYNFNFNLYYDQGFCTLKSSFQLLSHAIQMQFPRLSAVLQSCSITPAVWATPYFLTLFTYNLPFSIAIKFIDVGFLLFLKDPDTSIENDSIHFNEERNSGNFTINHQIIWRRRKLQWETEPTNEEKEALNEVRSSSIDPPLQEWIIRVLLALLHRFQLKYPSLSEEEQFQTILQYLNRPAVEVSEVGNLIQTALNFQFQWDWTQELRRMEQERQENRRKRQANGQEVDEEEEKEREEMNRLLKAFEFQF
jgi:hypothetical protein